MILQEALLRREGYRPTWTTRVTPIGRVSQKRWSAFCSDLMKGLARNHIPSYRRTHDPISHPHDHLLHRACRTDAREVIRKQIVRASKKTGVRVHFSVTPIRNVIGMIKYITTTTKKHRLYKREVFPRYCRAASWSRDFLPATMSEIWLMLRERWFPGSTPSAGARSGSKLSWGARLILLAPAPGVPRSPPESLLPLGWTWRRRKR